MKKIILFILLLPSSLTKPVDDATQNSLVALYYVVSTVVILHDVVRWHYDIDLVEMVKDPQDRGRLLELADQFFNDIHGNGADD